MQILRHCTVQRLFPSASIHFVESGLYLKGLKSRDEAQHGGRLQLIQRVSMSEFSSSSADELDNQGHGPAGGELGLSSSREERTSSSAISSEEGGSIKSSGSGKSSQAASPSKKRGSIGSRVRSFYNYLSGKSSPSGGLKGKASRNTKSGFSERDDDSLDTKISLGNRGMDLPDPVLQGTSAFGTLTFNKNLALMLRLYLPEVMQIQAYKLVYSLYNHGTDLATFYKGARGHDYSLILVETLNGSVFGGFCSREWKPVGSYFGTGESFIFSFDRNQKREEKVDNSDEGAVSVHRWTTRNNYFCFADNDKIAMGGGGGGFGFVIDADFRTCESSPCETYGNLTSLDAGNTTGTAGRIANVELWAFVSAN